MFRRALLAAGVAAAAVTFPIAARAIVGGGEGSGGGLARSVIMVLNSRGGVCSGVVVAPDAVLTAGHCVAGQVESRVHYRGDDGAPVLITPADQALHPGFQARAVETRRRSVDLALLRLPAPLPGRFAAAALADRLVPKGVGVIVGGYGVAREGEARSTGTFRSASLGAVEPYGPSRLLLWASGARGAGACEGDSGGPIALEDGSVVAVTSWAAGAGQAGCGSMSQGILVSPQRGWIDRILAGWGRAAEWR